MMRNIADIVQFNLEKEGYEVHLAYDGEEAIKMTYEVLPDLILLDIMMPKKKMGSSIKENQKDLDTPV